MAVRLLRAEPLRELDARRAVGRLPPQVLGELGRLAPEPRGLEGLALELGRGGLGVRARGRERGRRLDLVRGRALELALFIFVSA